MHDFCLTFPFAALLLLGGAAGYVRRGSVHSLAMATACSLILSFAGYSQLSAFKTGGNSVLAMLLQLAISISLAVVLGQRYAETGKLMPAGIVAVLSALMALFYAYKLLRGGNIISKKVSSD